MHVPSVDSSSDRIEKDELNTFTRIVTEQGEYELWNSINKSQEAQILSYLALKAGSLPLSNKSQDQQKLLFGKGAFGKVRLAKKGEKFYAVKKILLTAEDIDFHSIQKEHQFGQILAHLNIPHVVYSTDSKIVKNKYGEEKLYLFLNKIASLGNGDNLKSLLSYLDSNERNAILKHAARMLSESVAAMHDYNIYHRDLKAENILVSSTGEINISDFGSGAIDHEIVASLLKEGEEIFTVGTHSDARYYPPEIHFATVGGKIHVSNERLDNWRLGLTLLQLCGCIKPDHGILKSIRRKLDFLSNTPDGLEELNNHFQELIDDIKNTSLHKIPVELRSVIFGLLNVDPEKRLTARQAFLQLPPKTDEDNILVSKGFANLTRAQVAQAVKKSIKRALKIEAATKPEMWWYEAKNAFEELFQDPLIQPSKLQNYIRDWLSEANRPSLTHNQLLVLIKLTLEKQRGQKSRYNHVKVKQTTENLQNNNASSWTRAAPPLESNQEEDVISHQTPPVESPSPSVPTKKDEDEILTHLEQQIKNAVDQLLQYAKKKGGNLNFDTLLIQSKQNLDSLLHRIRKHINPSRILGFFRRKEDKMEISINSASNADEKAIQAVLSRQQQIISQLTIGKLYSMNDSERASIHQMLKKDKTFLIEIMKNHGSSNDQYQNIIEQLDEKLKLLDIIKATDVTVSLGPISNEHFNTTPDETFAVEDEVGELKYTFLKLKNAIAYNTRSKSDQNFNNFIVGETLEQNMDLDDIYIYTSDRNIGHTIADRIYPFVRNHNLKIYVNDKNVVLHNVGDRPTNNFGFFENNPYRRAIYDQRAQLTIKRVGNNLAAAQRNTRM